MQPEIHILGITLQSFGIMLGLAFVVCAILTARYLQEIGKPVDWAYEFIFAALVGGIVGARLWWIAENWSQAKGDLLGSLFSGSGLVFYGGALGGAVAVLLWSWHRGFMDGRTFDMGAAPLAAGYAIGRIGCPAGGGRRLRHRVERPVGDDLPARHRADDDPGAPDPDLRDDRDGPRVRVAVAPPAQLPAGHAVRPVGGAGGDRALPDRVHPPQRRGGRGPHAA